jgi:hypothetical protein
MDPITAVGLVGSIARLIDITVTVIGYINQVKHAEADREKLALEITSLLGLLTFLRCRLEEANSTDPWFIGIRSLGSENGLLDQFVKTMEELEDKLNPKNVTGKLKKMNLFWPLGRKEAEGTLAKIEQLKSSIGLHLQGDSLWVPWWQLRIICVLTNHLQQTDTGDQSRYSWAHEERRSAPTKSER